MDKPDALRLADAIEKAIRPEASLPLGDWARAAAELRRLHAENASLSAALASSCDEQRHELWESGGIAGCERARVAERQRDALLAEHQQTLALQQRSYEREIQLEVEAERERIGDQCAEQLKTAIEDEREACAKLCEDYDDDRGTGETWGPRFAALIRARTP